MKLLKNVYQIIRAVRFSKPNRAKVLIFDRGGSENLLGTALRDIPCSVLAARMEEIHLSPSIIWGILKNLRRLESFRPGQLYTIYLLSCIEQIEPAVVITWVDNSPYFQALTRLYTTAVFLAVQNGFRHELSVSSPSQKAGGWLPEPPSPGSTITLSNFFCFGQYVVDIFTRYGHDIGRYYLVGSVLAGYYKTVISPGEAEIEHDLCLVSEWSGVIMSGIAYPMIKRGLERLYRYLRRYLEENDLKVVIGGCSREEAESHYYASAFGERAVFIANDAPSFSTYRAMDRSDLVVSLYSTAAFEAFGWGKKTLFCNLSDDENLSCPVKGIWSFADSSYEKFRERMDILRGLSIPQYAAHAGEAARYMMRFDPKRPAHGVIRDTVREALERRVELR